MAITIRVLRAGDEALLLGAASGVFDDPVSPELAREFLSDSRHHVAVGIDDGRVVAMATGVSYVHPDKDTEMWVNEVGTAPAHRGRGIGKAVVLALLDHARRIGCREAWVLTDRENGAAMRLYRSLGGEEGAVPQILFTFRLQPADPAAPSR